MDCFLIVNIIIFQVSREYLLWKERFQWFCTTITTTTILYVFSENSWIKTITTTKIELKLYKKHITLSAEHKNANVFCTAYEFISLFFFLFVSYSTTTKSGVWMIFGGKYAHCFEKKMEKDKKNVVQYFLPFSWEFQGLSNILFVCNIFIWTIKCILLSGNGWKVALQIVGLKFYKNAKKSSIYSQSLLICVHKTPVVENHLTTWEIKRFTTAQVDTMGRHVLFLDDQLAHLHTGVDNYHRNLPAKKQWNPINSFREEIFQRFYFIP